MNVYILTREGVYRHEILGVYENREDAMVAGKKASEGERDNYHNILLSRAIVGEVLQDAVPLVNWSWIRAEGEHHYSTKKGKMVVRVYD